MAPSVQTQSLVEVKQGSVASLEALPPPRTPPAQKGDGASG